MAAMKDPVADVIRPGDKTDRKMSTTTAAATGAGAALTIGFVDWLAESMRGGQWHWFVPNQQLLEMAAPILLLPVGLWFARVLSLVGEIITNHLQKEAGEEK